VGGWNEFSVNRAAGDHVLDNFLGGIAYANSRFGVALNAQVGPNSDFNIAGVGPYSNRTVVNFLGTVNILDRLNYLVDAVYGHQDQTLGFNALDSVGASWYGVTQQLIYSIDEKWSVGARFEWFADPQGYLVTGLRPGNTDALFRFPGNYYDGSLGVNFKPVPNVTLGAEIRYDKYDGQGGYVAPAVFGTPPNLPYANNAKANQFLLGVNAIVQF
jgi:Putative beta-barrel porin-2, OmpL-like. bbp2